MPCFLVPQEIHSDPRAIEAGLAAMGLWMVAACWATQYVTSGFVPDAALSRLAGSPDEAHALGKQLVAVGLWNRDDERAGYGFTEWPH